MWKGDERAERAMMDLVRVVSEEGTKKDRLLIDTDPMGAVRPTFMVDIVNSLSAQDIYEKCTRVKYID